MDLQPPIYTFLVVMRTRKFLLGLCDTYLSPAFFSQTFKDLHGNLVGFLAIKKDQQDAFLSPQNVKI